MKCPVLACQQAAWQFEVAHDVVDYKSVQHMWTVQLCNQKPVGVIAMLFDMICGPIALNGFLGVASGHNSERMNSVTLRCHCWTAQSGREWSDMVCVWVISNLKVRYPVGTDYRVGTAFTLVILCMTLVCHLSTCHVQWLDGHIYTTLNCLSGCIWARESYKAKPFALAMPHPCTPAEGSVFCRCSSSVLSWRFYSWKLISFYPEIQLSSLHSILHWVVSRFTF